jgi:hypothetical protein
MKSDDLVTHDELSTGDVFGESEGERLLGLENSRLDPFGGSCLESDFVNLEPVDLGRIGLGAVVVGALAKVGDDGSTVMGPAAPVEGNFASGSNGCGEDRGDLITTTG